MRQESVTYTLYTYDELSEKAKEKAIEKFFDINVSFDWWDSSYDWFKEQLNEIGLDCKTFYFDLDRNSHIEAVDLHFIDVEKFVRSFVPAIKKSLIDVSDLFIAQSSGRHTISRVESNFYSRSTLPRLNREVDGLLERANDKLNDILENFRITLQKESEYLQSREAIEETIRCNDYEFLEDGSLYR